MLPACGLGCRHVDTRQEGRGAGGVRFVVHIPSFPKEYNLPPPHLRVPHTGQVIPDHEQTMTNQNQTTAKTKPSLRHYLRHFIKVLSGIDEPIVEAL